LSIFTAGVVLFCSCALSGLYLSYQAEQAVLNERLKAKQITQDDWLDRSDENLKAYYPLTSV